MKYSALASGSNGNCYYIAHGEDAILIDVGINAKHVERRMANLGLAASMIKAIFITHEHADHIRGLSVFSKRYRIPVYATSGSHDASKLQLPEDLVYIIRQDEEMKIGDLTVAAIPKFHDAREPCSYMVSADGTNIGILTDIGRVCQHVKEVVRQSDVLLLEANYDEGMLGAGNYPFFLKNRIQSGWGHLANHIALETYLECRTSRLRHLILGHLSAKNNSIERVEEVFSPHCKGVRLSIATRAHETELFDTKSLLRSLTGEIAI